MEAILWSWIRTAEKGRGDVVMGIETQQHTGWAMDGRTTPQSAVMNTFRWDAGGVGAAGGRRYKK